MAKVHIFNAGPCVLPKQATEAAREAILNFDNTGVGVLEISHRTPGWERIMSETVQLWRDLLNIPENYKILFLGGGASTQFFTVPANLLNKKAAYLQTGVWAKKAVKEAKLFGETVVVASSEDKNYSYIPKGYEIPKDADYFHITTNNTIYGTEIKYDMDCPVNLVADMSSDIMSRPVDVTKYALISKERRSCRRYIRYSKGRRFRQNNRQSKSSCIAYNGGLQKPYRQRKHVQHTSCILNLRYARNIEVVERKRRR